MHLDFKFDVSAIQRQFRRLQEVGKSDGLTRKIANVLWEDAEDAFEREQSPDGQNWEALQPNTQKDRARQGYDGKILQRTGNLVNSLNLSYGDTYAAIGAAEPYGQYHQTGTSRMSARPFLGLSAAGADEIKEIIARRIKEVFNE